MVGRVSTLQGLRAMLKPDVTSSVPAQAQIAAELELDLYPALNGEQKGN